MGKGDNRLTRLVRRRRSQRKKKAKQKALLEGSLGSQKKDRA